MKVLALVCFVGVCIAQAAVDKIHYTKLDPMSFDFQMAYGNDILAV